MKDLLLNSSRHNNPKISQKFYFIFFIFIFIFSFLIPAEARVYIQIDQASEKKFPIAVVDLVPVNRGTSKDWNHEITDIIIDDLKLTGLFEIIPPNQYPTSPGALLTNPASIQFPPWTLIGAQALINGSYSNTKGGMQVELNLYDPFLGQHLVSRSYITKDSERAVVANHFADEVVKELTGERGVFSTQIAYTQIVKKGKEIGVMTMNGGNAHNITKDKSINLSPAWTPNGSQIVYTSFGRNASPEITIVGSEGGPSRRITSNGSINVSPTFTPHGVLTVVSALEGDTEIYLMNMAGNIIKRITNSFGIDVNPCWSPDGSSLVFASERAGRLHIFRSDASGGSVERLTFVGTQNDNPVWSPKGDKIAFQSLDGNWDIFLMNTDGSMIQRLTSSTGNNESPTWAPNGRFIAYSSTRNGPVEVTLMREDGSNQITIGPSGSTQPTWGPWVK